MLELKNCGKAMGGEDAVKILESLPGMLSESMKTDVFCDEYECALNRLRYLVSRHVPIQPKVCKTRFTSYTCGACGYGLAWGQKFCENCGRAADWYVLRAGQERKRR